MNSAPLFSLRGVTLARQERPILQGVDLDLPRHGVTAIVGPSGAGKTSLLRLLNRLDDPDAGTIKLDGRPLLEYPIRALRRRVGFVFQSPTMFEGTVADNLRLAGAVGEPHATCSDASIQAILNVCGLDASYAERPATTLSGGEQQRVALARSLVTQPEILLLDEPTAALDPEVADQLMATLRAVGTTSQSSNPATHEHTSRLATTPLPLPKTIILITHRLAEARMVSDHLVMLERGRVVETGRTRDLFTNPTSPRTRTYLSSADLA